MSMQEYRESSYDRSERARAFQMKFQQLEECNNAPPEPKKPVPQVGYLNGHKMTYPYDPNHSAK